MTMTIDGRTSIDRRPEAVRLTPVTDGDRPVGAWIVGPDGATFRPVIDVTRLTTTVLAGVGAVAIAAAAVLAAGRHRPAIGTVTMGPGGWVSVKGLKPPLRPTASRPRWARLLHAQRLGDTC